MQTTPQNEKKQQTSREIKTIQGEHLLYQRAFDFSFHANIITTASSGKIIIANHAACKLLGYSKKELLAKTQSQIFDTSETSFRIMLRQRMDKEHAVAYVTVIKKSGKRIPCEITSAIFIDNKGVKKAITTVADISQSLLKQKQIDTRKEKIVADNIFFAVSRQKDIDVKNEKIVADNIILAMSKQKDIDIKNKKIVAFNIVQAMSKQKNIDVKNKKRVADNIILAQAKSDAFLEERLGEANVLKAVQIARASEDARDTERSDIGKELHDNINQLLGASNLYMGMAKRDGENRKLYLSRSSEYTLTAIEEIRKLTKKLTTDSLRQMGLCEAIENMASSTMEINPVKISCYLESFGEQKANDNFNLNIFRIVQEQLNNIIKHAGAKEVSIDLSQNEESTVLSISDNGIGFDTRKKRTGIGISNIKSRAKSYNGTADFISAPGEGCTLSVTFPAQRKNL